jgi:O-antigen/teichoic acid export membrane protein
MFDKIKRLGTDTAIYGISTIVGRFLTYILTPVYANVLPSSDVGIVATVFSYIAFLNVLFGYGMESAFMKYRSTLEVGDERQNFTVPFFSLTVSSLVLAALMIWQRGSLAALAGDPSTYVPLVSYVAVIVCLDTIAIVPFASLRLAQKAKQFAAIKLVSIVVNVACNLLFLIKYRTGIEGIFYSNMISSGVALVLLVPTILSNLRFSWNSTLYESLLRFGLPYVPAGIAGMMIQVIDRPILLALTDESTVGIYQANYRLGIFMMLVVSMFDFAWRPFFLTHAKDPDAKQMFARVLTYFVLLMTGVLLVLSFFLEDIVKPPIFWHHSILPAEYWHGLAIVPVILLGYLFLGVSNNFVAGVYIEKKTQHLPAITFIGAIINVVVNFLLIPYLGIMGAAFATLMSYAAMAIALYLVVQRFYPVHYEFGRIGKVALAGAVVFLLYYFVRLESFEFLWKVILLVLFVALMYWMKFFEETELNVITRLFTRQRGDEEPSSESSTNGFSEPK